MTWRRPRCAYQKLLPDRPSKLGCGISNADIHIGLDQIFGGMQMKSMSIAESSPERPDFDNEISDWVDQNVKNNIIRPPDVDPNMPVLDRLPNPKPPQVDENGGVHLEGIGPGKNI